MGEKLGYDPTAEQNHEIQHIKIEGGRPEFANPTKAVEVFQNLKEITESN